MARWLTRADNPLTARVLVNRIWLWHFGEGLVRSPDNFGKLGQRPTHPELLDWLAVQLRRIGLVDQGAASHDHALVDVSDEYGVERASRVRSIPRTNCCGDSIGGELEAESIRDSILAVAGQLDLRMGGSMLPTKNRAYVTSTANVDPVAYETNRRSIYLPVVRSACTTCFKPSTLPNQAFRPASGNPRRWPRKPCS